MRYHVMLQLSFVLCASDINIVDDFNTAHVSVVDTLASLSFLPRNFFAQPEEKKLPKGRKSIEGKSPTVRAELVYDGAKSHGRLPFCN